MRSGSALFDVISGTGNNGPPTLLSFVCNPNPVEGGQTTTGIVTLSGPAPAGGLLVTITTANSALAYPRSTIVIPEGQVTTTFAIPTVAVQTQTTVTLSVSAGVATRSVALVLMPPSIGDLTLSLNPDTVDGGDDSTGTVTITRTLPQGVNVVLTTSDACATVPPYIVLNGALSKSFQIYTKPVTETKTVTITATTNGITRTATLIVKTPVLTGLTVTPSPCLSGETLQITLTVSRPAPVGYTIALSSDNPAIPVPA